ncbi:MAG: hypothetical protein U0R78_00315 [Nocardioidaceae bacterium]
MTHASRAVGRVRRSALSAALLAVIVVLGTPAASRAETWLGPDWDGDVVHVDATDASDVSWANDVAFGDLTGARVSYRQGRVVADAHLAELDHSRDTFGVSVTLRHADRIRFLYTNAVVWVRDGHWRGTARLYGDVASARCEVDHVVDYRRDVIRMSIPSRCLGSPRWVRAMMLSASMVDGAETWESDSLPGPAGVFGPRVHRAPRSA